MQYKQYEKSMLIYRGRKKNNPTSSSKHQIHLNNKSQNLKSIHRTLVQTTKKENFMLPQRSTIVNNPNANNNSYRYNSKSKNNLSMSSHNKSEIYNQREKQQKSKEKEKSKQKQRDKSVNFYINIQKLKNLKISSRKQQSNLSQNSYIKKSSQFSLDKKSLILKSEHKQKVSSNHNSYNQIQSSLGSKLPISIVRPNNPKSKLRYKTHQNQVQEDVVRSHASQYMFQRNSNFRRQTNDLKDKTFIDGYLKGKQLGRGGFSKVWEGFHFKTKQFYAVKEIDTTNKYQTHLTEIWFGNHFFQQGGAPKKEMLKHPGVHRLLQMFQYSIVDPRAFIVYENCDGSLGNMLYDIYEEDRDDDEVDQDEKLYMIKYKTLYGELRKSPNFLKKLIKQLAEALDLLASNRIVHSDIKTQNILLKRSQNGGHNYEFKLIDYGSSFMFESLKQYKLATPQYMCPELLNYILFQNKKPCHQYMLQYVKLYENISAIDVWGLGCILIQLIHGLPLWLNNPTKIMVNGNYQTKKGLFAVGDRSFSKILEKQLSIVNNFDDFLKKQNNSQILVDQQIKGIIKSMLNPNPKHRIRPFQIIQRLCS